MPGSQHLEWLEESWEELEKPAQVWGVLCGGSPARGGFRGGLAWSLLVLNGSISLWQEDTLGKMHLFNGDRKKRDEMRDFKC